MNKVLVTGADGFIGSHLVEALVHQGYNVKAFVLYNSFSSWGLLDKLAPEILDVSLSYRTGICHVAGPRRSFYELGLERNPNVKPGSIVEAQSISNVPILVDTSLDIN